MIVVSVVVNKSSSEAVLQQFVLELIDPLKPQILYLLLKVASEFIIVFATTAFAASAA